MKLKILMIFNSFEAWFQIISVLDSAASQISTNTDLLRSKCWEINEKFYEANYTLRYSIAINWRISFFSEKIHVMITEHFPTVPKITIYTLHQGYIGVKMPVIPNIVGRGGGLLLFNTNDRWLNKYMF